MAPASAWPTRHADRWPVGAYAIIGAMQKFKQRLLYYVTLDGWQKWEYKHTTLVALSLVLFIMLLDTAIFAFFMEWVLELEYLGAFLIGLLFVSLFSTTPAVVLIVLLVGKGTDP